MVIFSNAKERTAATKVKTRQLWSRRSAAAALTAALLLLHCGDSNRVEQSDRLPIAPEQAAPVEEAAPPTPDMRVEPPRESGDVTFPPAWCDRAVPDSYDVLSGVARSYYEAQLARCETSKLTRDLELEERLEWLNYLIDYTHALSGCAIPPTSFGGRGFLPGGISQFGPANLAALGAPQPQLGSDDVALLIDEYVGPLSQALALSSVEEEAVRSFLLDAAQLQIAEGLSGSLSACDED